MDKFQRILMEKTLMDHRVNLTSATAEVYCTVLLKSPWDGGVLTDVNLSTLNKKLFHKIAQGNFIRGSETGKFMAFMLRGNW